MLSIWLVVNDFPINKLELLSQPKVAYILAIKFGFERCSYLRSYTKNIEFNLVREFRRNVNIYRMNSVGNEERKKKRGWKCDPERRKKTVAQVL